MPLTTPSLSLYLSLFLCNYTSIHEAMRGMERFAALPFSIGCASQSSVAVSENQPKRAQTEATPPPKRFVSEGGEEESLSKPKNSFGFLPLPKLNISAGIHRIIKSFKSLSQIFSEYEEEDGEVEMEIGLPTDVQHLTHIGWDGSNNVSTTMKSWEKAPEFLSLQSLSLRQFELAMASQADAQI